MVSYTQEEYGEHACLLYMGLGGPSGLLCLTPFYPPGQ